MEEARIYTFSIMRSSTEAFVDKTPYCTAILETEDGTRFAALLEGYRDGCVVKVGQTVKSVGIDGQGKEQYAI